MGKTADFFADEDVPRARVALLLEHFSRLEDDREPWRIVYPLSEVLLLLTCATIASLRRLRRDRRFWPSPSRSPEEIRALLQWHPLRALAARVGEPDRSGDIRKLFRRLDSRAVARPPRPHRHRRQDFASHSRQAKGPQSAAHAQRLRDQRPSHAGANQRAGEDQRDHGHSRSARSSGREETTRRRPRHHRRDGVSGRPMITSTDPLTMKNALSPSSPSEMMVSPALNAMACMNLSASLDRSLAPPPGDDGGAGLPGQHATR